VKKNIKEQLPKHISPPDNYFWFYIGKEYYKRMQEPPPYSFKFKSYIQNIKKVKELCEK